VPGVEIQIDGKDAPHHRHVVALHFTQLRPAVGHVEEAKPQIARAVQRRAVLVVGKLPLQGKAGSKRDSRRQHVLDGRWEHGVIILITRQDNAGQSQYGQSHQSQDRPYSTIPTALQLHIYSSGVMIGEQDCYPRRRIGNGCPRRSGSCWEEAGVRCLPLDLWYLSAIPAVAVPPALCYYFGIILHSSIILAALVYPFSVRFMSLVGSVSPPILATGTGRRLIAAMR